MKPTIDEQIEAVEKAMVGCSPEFYRKNGDGLQAARATLNWVKRHAPTIKAIREEFPGSRIEEREE